MALVAYALMASAFGQPVQEAPLLEPAQRTVAAGEFRYFPVLVAAEDGSLRAVIRGGAPHLGIGGRLDWIESQDGGVTWSEPVTIVDSEWDDRNPAFGQMADGSWALGYAECRNYDAEGRWGGGDGFVLRFMRSEDGVVWSTPEPLAHPFGPQCSPYGRIIVLPDGRALMSVYGEPTAESASLFTVGDPNGQWACGFVVSADNGRSWGEFTPIARGYSETTLVLMPDGELVALARSCGDQHVALLRSHDQGATWSDPEPLTLGSQHPADGVALASGELLVVYGSRLTPYGVHVMVGKPEELASAPRAALAVDSLNTDQGYPSVAVTEDGAVCVYYAVGTSEVPDDEIIVSVGFDPERVPRGGGGQDR